uniref:Uncharacterized protein n=1 Tax=Acrobeloides nanus TaxID=290746 RepID=A0A914CT13_9BILA
MKSTIVTTVLKSQMRKPSAELKHHAIQINKGNLAGKSLVGTKLSSPQGDSVRMPPIPKVSDSRNEKTSSKTMANNTIVNTSTRSTSVQPIRSQPRLNSELVNKTGNVVKSKLNNPKKKENQIDQRKLETALKNLTLERGLYCSTASNNTQGSAFWERLSKPKHTQGKSLL